MPYQYVIFPLFFRTIWNINSASNNYTLEIIPEGKGDAIVYTLDSALNDSLPEKVDDIGDFTFMLKDGNGNQVLNETHKLKLGASYEFLVQYDEMDPENSRNITVLQ